MGAIKEIEEIDRRLRATISDLRQAYYKLGEEVYDIIVPKLKELNLDVVGVEVKNEFEDPTGFYIQININTANPKLNFNEWKELVKMTRDYIDKNFKEYSKYISLRFG